eukprot:1063626-Prymnesium_polylepis.1
MSVSLPHVTRAWALPEEAAGSATTVPDALRGRRVFVWVHGFRQRYFRVIGVASHLAHRLGCE